MNLEKSKLKQQLTLFFITFYAIVFTFTLFHFVLGNNFKTVNNQKFDAIVVFGFPANVNNTVSPTLKTRMDKAIELYNQNQINYVFLLGGAAHNKITESKVMRNYAMANGIAAKQIFIDSLSTNTIENTRNLLSIIDKQNLKINTAILVSSNYHLYRIGKLVSKNSKIHFVKVGAIYHQQIGFFGKLMALFREMVMWAFHLIFSYKV